VPEEPPSDPWSPTPLDAGAGDFAAPTEDFEPWAEGPAADPNAVSDDVAEPAASAEPADPAPIAPPESWGERGSIVSRHNDPVEDAFNAWYEGDAPAAGDSGSAAPTSPTEPAAQDEPRADPAGTAGAPAASSPRPDVTGGEGDDDEDLAMFRTWLQSLKK
jgi:hypothetical protein